MIKERPSTLRREIAQTWSPQRRTLKLDLFRPVNPNVPTTLDEQTIAGIETQMSIHLGGNSGMDALVKTEGISRYQYVKSKSSIGKRLKNFMKS